MHLSLSIYPYVFSVYSGDLVRAGLMTERISAGQVCLIPLWGSPLCVGRAGPWLAGFFEPLVGSLSMSVLCLVTSTVGRLSGTECPQTTSVKVVLAIYGWIDG